MCWAQPSFSRSSGPSAGRMNSPLLAYVYFRFSFGRSLANFFARSACSFAFFSPVQISQVLRYGYLFTVNIQAQPPALIQIVAVI